MQDSGAQLGQGCTPVGPVVNLRASSVCLAASLSRLSYLLPLNLCMLQPLPSDEHQKDRTPRADGNSAGLLARSSVARSARSGPFSTASRLLHRTKSARARSFYHSRHVRAFLHPAKPLPLCAPPTRLSHCLSVPRLRARLCIGCCCIKLFRLISQCVLQTTQRAGRGRSSAGDHRQVRGRGRVRRRRILGA